MNVKRKSMFESIGHNLHLLGAVGLTLATYAKGEDFDVVRAIAIVGLCVLQYLADINRTLKLWNAGTLEQEANHAE